MQTGHSVQAPSVPAEAAVLRGPRGTKVGTSNGSTEGCISACPRAAPLHGPSLLTSASATAASWSLHPLLHPETHPSPNTGRVSSAPRTMLDSVIHRPHFTGVGTEVKGTGSYH